MSASSEAILPSQHADPPTGRRRAFEQALDQQQRLGPHELAVALVDLRSDDDVDRAALVLEQQEDDSPAVEGRWRATTMPPTATRLRSGRRASWSDTVTPVRRGRRIASAWSDAVTPEVE